MSEMRESTRQKINALHRQIADLIEAEKKHYDSKHPGQNDLLRSINHCRIEWHQHSPEYRDRQVTTHQRAYNDD